MIALLAIATAVALAFIWIEQFYRVIGTNSLLSDGSPDYPLMPFGMHAVPVIGNHFFGDFQRPYGWAMEIRQSINPYVNSGANYPPFSILFLVPFTLLRANHATVVFLLLTGVVFLLPLWLLLAPLRLSYRCITLVISAMITTPFIAIFDRGNLVGIATGLAAWAVLAWRKERWMWCSAMLALAIALKGYPVALLIAPLALRKYRVAIFAALGAIGLNLISLAFVAGGYFTNLRVIEHAVILQKQGTDGQQLRYLGLYSLVPKVDVLLFGSAHLTNLLHPSLLVGWIPSIIYLAAVYFIIRRGRTPQWCWGPLCLASIQLIGGFGGGVYTSGWACIAAVWFMQGSLGRDRASTAERESQPGRNFVILRVLTLSAIVCALVPSTFSINRAGSLVPFTGFLGPALLVVTTIVAFALSLSHSEKESPAGVEALGSTAQIHELLEAVAVG